MGFQPRPALQIRRFARFAFLAQQVATEKEPVLLRSTQYRGTIGHQFAEEPGEQLLQDLRPSWQQPVSVPALGYSLAVRHGLRQPTQSTLP